ncbi:MAG: hypothetical protein MJE77_22770 [Proteobacteria bacterium]|nr:hypothetical protein [Pseudomonadota bacterium]
MSSTVLALFRLALFFFAIALATSRFTLILHEIVGHGAMVKAVGSTVVGYHLYWFAGGFIEFHRAEPYTQAEEMLIFLGGIGVEVVLGAMLLVVARITRPGSIARIGLIGSAAILLIHAGYYLTAGTFHGFGDGWVLHRALGGARLYWVAVATVLLLAGAHLLTGHFMAHVRPLVAGARRPAVMVGTAALLAALGHLALSFAEMAVSPNPTYKLTMRHHSEREVERELSVYIRAIESERGQQPEGRELVEVERELRKKHATFPFARVLVFLLVLAVVSGMARPGRKRPRQARDGTGEGAHSAGHVAQPASFRADLAPPTIAWHDLALPSALVLVSLLLVGILQLLA